MSNHSPHPSSLSPHSKQPKSAFQWPIPSSPSAMKPSNNSSNTTSSNDITVKEILDRYNDDPELLKYILTAKSEEDKKKAAKDTLKAEEARIQLRQMDLEFAREQSKASARYERQPYPSLNYPPPHLQQPPVQPGPPPPSHPHAYPYYSLSPVQQQVLARFNHPPHYGQQGQHAQPPPSPSVPYPHSAHPLCPPSNEDKSHRLQPHTSQLRQVSPTSPGASTTTEDPLVNKNLKRNRSSVSSLNEPNESQQDKIPHNKVMEALKAKIQRGSTGPLSPSPLNNPPTNNLLNGNSTANNNNSTRPLNQQQQDYTHKKRKASTLPRPVVIQETPTSSISSPSPRSAKPILPPIDTNLGRINMNTKTTTKPESDTSNSHESHDKVVKDEETASNNKKDDHAKASQKTDTTTYSPSDHILLNTRRPRSLSSSSASSPLVSKDK